MEFNKHTRAVAGFLLGSVVAFSVNAQNTTADFNSWFWNTEGNRHMGSAGSGPGAVGVPATISGSTARGFDFSHPTGLPEARSSARLPGSGQVIDVQAKVLPSSAGAAIFRTAAKIAFPVQVGVAVYDLYKELGLDLKWNGTQNVATQVINGGCPPLPEPWRSEPRDASCGGYAPGSFYKPLPPPNVMSSNMCAIVNYCTGYTSVVGTYAYPDLNAPGAPITQQEFIDKIAAKSGWPSTSNISRAIAQAAKSGEMMQTNNPTVTGPATSPGPVSKVTNPDGSIVTKTGTNNYAYAGNTVTVTNTNVTTNYNPTNNITTTTTETADAAPSQSECQKSPNSIGCGEIDVPEGEIPKVKKDVSYVAETMFGSGTCPADISVAQSLTGRPVKLSYTPTCNALATYVKPIIIAIALFMAYLIILPGRTD